MAGKLEKEVAKKRLRQRGSGQVTPAPFEFGPTPQQEFAQASQGVGQPTGDARLAGVGRTLAAQPASGNVAADTATGAAAGALVAGPAGAAVVGGSALVSGLLKQRAQREREKIANEIARRKNLSDAISTGATRQSSALQSIIANLAKALL